LPPYIFSFLVTAGRREIDLFHLFCSFSCTPSVSFRTSHGMSWRNNFHPQSHRSRRSVAPGDHLVMGRLLCRRISDDGSEHNASGWCSVEHRMQHASIDEEHTAAFFDTAIWGPLVILMDIIPYRRWYHYTIRLALNQAIENRTTHQEEQYALR